MYNLAKNFYICFLLFFPFFSFGDNICSQFKYDVDININNTTKDTINITSSKEKLSGKLGYTESKMAYEYKSLLIPVRVKGGFCVSLRGIDVNVFFPEFNITIDKRLKPDTCAYNVVFNHEQDHVNVYKNVLKENIGDIKNALKDAAKTIEPVFVKNLDNQENVQKIMIENLEKNKSVVQIQEKILKYLEQENEKVDTRGDDYQVWKCKDFYEEMSKSGESIRID